ncbi:hypothetical protein [Cellulomonas bogoriensis]|nr:hypothetical protein [Cellulomonas bogoriensis]
MTCTREESTAGRALLLPGCRGVSSWGHDPELESYWAEVVTLDGRTLLVGAEHLVPTVAALGHALDRELGLEPGHGTLCLLGGVYAGQAQLSCGRRALDIAS